MTYIRCLVVMALLFLPAPTIATETKPLIVSATKPSYPRVAYESGWEGAVIVRALIATDGVPSQVEIKKSSGHEALDLAAQEAIKSWKFQPAKDGNILIAKWVDIPIKFDLNSSNVTPTHADNPTQKDFEELVARHSLNLSSPSQDLTIGMFVGGKEVVGFKAYFQNLKYYGPSHSMPGAIVLWTYYPPGVGLPGIYLVIFKTENLQPQDSYSCVIQITDTFTALTTFFHRLTEFYYAYNGFALAPSTFWMMPFKEKTYEIPIVQEIECLPSHMKPTDGSIFYEEFPLP